MRPHPTIPTICALVFSLHPAHAQAPASKAAFDDLARRAEAAVDARPAEAVSLYRKALAIRPDWTEGWFYLGGAFYQLDRYPEATDAFRRVVTLAPAHGTAWAFLGLSEAELDDSEQALDDIRKGQQLGIGDNQGFEIAVRVKAARLLVESSSIDEALLQIVPLAKRGVDSPAVVETMGLCALGLPRRLSQLTPEQRAVAALAGKAAWANAGEHPEEAAAAYRQLAAQYPNEPGVHYARALYFTETDLQSSMAELEQEILIDPSHWPALIVLASFRIKQGEAGPAIQALTEAIKLVPPRYRWLCHAELGRANLNSDKLDTAIAELRAAARLKPEYAQIHFLLADAYRRDGRKDDAQKERAEFQKLQVQEDPLSIPALRPFAGAGR